VHFGEVECGRIDDNPEGPIQRAAPGDPPYPEVMNSAAVAEIAALDPAAVIVKGDLSADGQPDEWRAFEDCYRTPFGAALHVVRGNHDAYHGQDEYAGDQAIDLPGVTIALLDTVVATRTGGRFSEAQASWLADVAADAARRGVPVVAMGHHQNWIGEPGQREAVRSTEYFGIDRDDSERLAEVVARHRAIVAYAAGHTHRHRVRRHPTTGDVPYIEVGCVKDFPGTWAEYQVYESAIVQVVHRVADPAALAWSERCRYLYADFGVDYQSYALGRLEDRCFTIELRA
jgi:3',5'-cyclic AMP phosphodiesterase CpdA